MTKSCITAIVCFLIVITTTWTGASGFIYGTGHPKKYARDSIFLFGSAKNQGLTRGDNDAVLVRRRDVLGRIMASSFLVGLVSSGGQPPQSAMAAAKTSASTYYPQVLQGNGESICLNPSSYIMAIHHP